MCLPFFVCLFPGRGFGGRSFSCVRGRRDASPLFFCFRGGETAVGPQGCDTSAGMESGTGAGSDRKPADGRRPRGHGVGRQGGAGAGTGARRGSAGQVGLGVQGGADGLTVDAVHAVTRSENAIEERRN